VSVAPPLPVARLSPAPPERRALRRAWPLVRPHRRQLAGAAVVSLVATGVELAVPMMVGVAVDAAVEGNAGRVRAAAAVAGVLAVVQLGLESGRRRAAAAAGERVLASVRTSVAAALLARPLGFFDANPPGEVLARVLATSWELGLVALAYVPWALAAVAYYRRAASSANAPRPTAPRPLRWR
jgi:ATP-binding cassette subfamily B protein